METYHRKPSGWQGSDKVFDSDGDIIDFQTAIVQYENGAALTFHTNLNVPDDFRRFAVMGAKGMAEGDFIRNFLRVTDSRTSDRLVDTTYKMSELSQHYGADEQMAEDILKHMLEGVPLPGCERRLPASLGEFGHIADRDEDRIERHRAERRIG